MGLHHPHAPIDKAAPSDHDGLKRQKATQKVTLVGAIANILLSAAQIIGGFFAQSQALIADGFHTLVDLLSNVIVIIAAQHAHKNADDNHPYGHGRSTKEVRNKSFNAPNLNVIIIHSAANFSHKAV